MTMSSLEMCIPWGNDSGFLPVALGVLVGLDCDTKDGVHLMPIVLNVGVTRKPHRTSG